MTSGFQKKQIPLCCPCGELELYRRGLCQVCYHRRRRSRSRFSGRREEILARDRHLCRVCRARYPLVVHHRRPSNLSSTLITLCRGCHARLHQLRTINRWVPDMLVELWAEQHPGRPRQLQLALSVTARAWAAPAEQHPGCPRQLQLPAAFS